MVTTNPLRSETIFIVYNDLSLNPKCTRHPSVIVSIHDEVHWTPAEQ